ncbi:response regulator transcription factor [Flavobacterium sp. N1719]|jgi:DNA-binding response OmpR family regulator|uniref:response regulator transcription factor n=1 Tax=Flavobacterium sp. N1719 TaxID=2885633 RepID=UPI0022233A9C|nr:response regulator [Flavobacterium sp. N1719]
MKKVLIIEDDKMIKTILQFLLNREGYQTDFAVEGKEGMEKLRSFNPDAVITDVMLPYRSGIEIVSLSKKLNPNRPVFVVSALGNESVTLEQAIEQGANEVLSKPFNPEDILEKLRSAFLLEAV